MQPVLSRRELSEPALRTEALVQSLTSHGIIAGAIRIPDAAATLHVIADLRANQIACHCDIEAPRQGRSRTRVNWLVRQLKDSPGALRIEAFVAHGRGASTAELLHAIRETPDPLIGDGSRDHRSFRITQMTAMGTKRGTGRGSFIDSVVDAVDTFYLDVLQNLRAWRPAAPKLREEPESPDIPPALVSTALSSQDEPDRTQPSALTPSSESDSPPVVTGVASE